MNDNRLGRRVRFAVPGLLALLCLTATGCGSSGSVSGKVSFNGEALGGGTVVFTSEGQGSATSQIGPDGSYKIDKIPVGPVKIAVETKSAQPAKRPPGMPTPPADAMAKDASSSPLYNPQNQSKGKYVPIPEDLGDPNKSGQTLTVTGGSQTYNIELK
jgi:hypothetical protein